MAWCSGDCTELHIEVLPTLRSWIIFRQEGFRTGENGGIAQFSPDGQKLAIATTSTMLTVDVATGRAVELGSVPRRGVSVSTAWSTDGKYLFWSTREPGTTMTAISRFDAETGEMHAAVVPIEFRGPLFLVIEAGSGGALTGADDLQPCIDSTNGTRQPADCVLGL